MKLREIKKRNNVAIAAYQRPEPSGIVSGCIYLVMVNPEDEDLLDFYLGDRFQFSMELEMLEYLCAKARTDLVPGRYTEED